MDDCSRGPGDRSRPEFQGSIRLTYARVEDVRRDLLPGVPRGLIARSGVPLGPGATVEVHMEVAGRAPASARGLVLWSTPLARGSLVGLELRPVGRRDSRELDLVLGSSGPAAPEAPDATGATEEAPALRVAMLQRNSVLRQVLHGALEKLARDKARSGALRFEAAGDVPSFVASVSARRPDLAVIDCDGVEDATEPILDVVRSSEETRRTPVILLSSSRSPRLEDPYTVTMQKPVGMKAFIRTADLLLGS